MAIPRVSDPLAVVKAVTRLAVAGLALAALLGILWLSRMTPPARPPAPDVSASVAAPPSKAPPVQTPRRAPYPTPRGEGPSGTGAVTPSPALPPGVHPL